MRDSASPLLRKLRNELRNGGARVRDELARVARSSEVRDALQESFLAERGGRPVLAVRASSRSKVPGVVHDASSTGQTLFVEPFAVVELNNRLAEAAADAREEVERILGELSAAVASRAEALRVLVESTGALDLALARGGLSQAWGGAPVEVSDHVQLAGRPSSAARRRDGGSDRPRPRRGPRARDQRPQHGRQDGCAEDDRAGRAAPPVRATPAGGRSEPAGLRPGARGHRRPPVDRDEPFDVLRAPAHACLDPRIGEWAIARPARRARRWDRSRGGLGPRAGAARTARAPGAPDRRDDALRRAEGMGECKRRRGQRRHGLRPRDG